MKTIKLALCMLFLAGTTNSCMWFYPHHEIFHVCTILLSFRDTLGNDLISGIEFDYYYDNDSVTYGEISNTDVFYRNSSISFGGSYNNVRIIKLDGYYYLLAEHYWGEDMASLPHGRIVIKLRCPHIFGDNDLYEFITYWEPEGKKIPQSRYTFFHDCSHIDLNGKEFPIEKNQYLSNASTSATIILDK